MIISALFQNMTLRQYLSVNCSGTFPVGSTEIDLTGDRDRGLFDGIRTIYIANTSFTPLKIIFKDTGFELLIPANSAGYFNTLSNTPAFTVVNTGIESYFQIHLMNFVIAPAVWSL